MSDEPDQEIEALIHPGDDGKFWAEVVGLHGCYAQGDNYSKILARLRDAHELCSGSGANAQPPAAPIKLDAGSSVADLKKALGESGWNESGEATDTHVLLAHGPSGARLCIPREETETLNSGFRTALAKYLGE